MNAVSIDGDDGDDVVPAADAVGACRIVATNAETDMEVLRWGFREGSGVPDAIIDTGTLVRFVGYFQAGFV